MSAMRNTGKNEELLDGKVMVRVDTKYTRECDTRVATDVCGYKGLGNHRRI